MDSFPSWVSWINAVSTVIIALAAIVTVILTVRMFRENKLLRQEQTEPRCVGFLRIQSRAIVTFVIKNIGRGPAYDVVFSFNAERDRFSKSDPRHELIGDRIPIAILSDDQFIEFFYGVSFKLLKEENRDPIKVSVEYKNSRGKAYQQTFQLDVLQFLGSWSPETPEQRLVRPLEKIERSISDIKSKIISR